MERVKVLGILGGIGCGKSTIGAAFADLGAAVLDADRSAHAALDDAAVRGAIAARFPGVARADGSIDRAALGAIVFAEPEARIALESLVHPRVKQDLHARFAAANDDPAVPLVVLDAPLLLEAGLESWCDALVFVDVPFAERARRVKESRGWSAEELARREANQVPLERKRARADHVLDNSGEPAAARREVAELFRRYARPSHGSAARSAGR